MQKGSWHAEVKAHKIGGMRCLHKRGRLSYVLLWEDMPEKSGTAATELNQHLTIVSYMAEEGNPAKSLLGSTRGSQHLCSQPRRAALPFARGNQTLFGQKAASDSAGFFSNTINTRKQM